MFLGLCQGPGPQEAPLLLLNPCKASALTWWRQYSCSLRPSKLPKDPLLLPSPCAFREHKVILGQTLKAHLL